MHAAASVGPRIGLLGMYASANLGDTCIQQEVMRGLRERIPACRFTAISNDPADAAATYGIDAMRIDGYPPALRGDGSPWHELQQPWPRGVTRGAGTRRIVAALRRLDLLVVSGGGQLEDFFGGTFAQPRYLLTWTLLARALGVPVVYFAVGVDQLRAPLSRRLVALALTAASARSFRDEGSLALAREAGMRGTAALCPDPALGALAAPSPAADPAARRVIAVSPVSHRTWRVDSDAAYQHYLDTLEAACRVWLASGLQLRFVCSERDMDPAVARDLMQRLPAGAAVQWVDAQRPDDFIHAAAGAEVLVNSRLHGAILGLLAGTPALAIAPARKVSRLMGDAGLARYCLDLSDLQLPALLDGVAALRAQRSEIDRQIGGYLTTCRRTLATAYDDLAERASRAAQRA
jgi:polysaccharide pyruvyl transferase WcaK-like protein